MIELTANVPWSAQVVPVQVRATEKISHCYSVTVDLLSGQESLDTREALKKSASVALSIEGATRSMPGIISEMSFMGSLPGGRYWYRLTIVPRLALLGLTRRSRVFCTEQPIPISEVIQQILDSAEGVTFADADSAGRLAATSYRPIEMAVQYSESDLAFLSRLIEHHGIFYFFEDDAGAEKVVFGDTNVAFPYVEGTRQLSYRPSVNIADPGPAIRSVATDTRLTIGQTRLNDWDDLSPGTALLVESALDPLGLGFSQFDEEDGYRDAAWGQSLVDIRLQEAVCSRFVLRGTSDCAGLSAGRVFSLTGHHSNEVNGQYLVVSVDHRAWSSGAGIESLPGMEQVGAGYANTFTAIPFSQPFRPARHTPWPSINGLLRAVVDGADTERADIDDLGRYRIIFPFDSVKRPPGKASSPVRLVTAHGGPNEGFHFPLRAKTQVMIAFVDGDPDRPVIVGPVYDAAQKSVATKENRYVNTISTASGILMKMNDGTPKSSP